MVLHRCAVCGSPNVVTDQENDGIQYDYIKGAIGTVVLGAGGAVAGISNKSKQVFKCRDCGMTLSYSLGEPYKSLIDTGVASAEGRKMLNINGFPISWDNIKKKFPNIESGAADLEVSVEEARRNRGIAQTVKYLMTLWEADNAKDIDFLQKSDADIEAEQAKWEEDKTQLAIQRANHLQSAMMEKEAEVKAINAEKIAKITEIDERKDAAVVALKDLQSQLATLGLFKFREKAYLKNQIARIEVDIESLTSAINAQTETYDKKIADMQRNLTYFQRDLNRKFDIIYASPESPKDRFTRLKEERADLRIGRFPLTSPKFYISRYYPKTLMYLGKASEEELVEIFDAFIREFTKLPSAFVTRTMISQVKRYYEPFLTTTTEGEITNHVGTITKRGVIYYEYIGM